MTSNCMRNLGFVIIIAVSITAQAKSPRSIIQIGTGISPPYQFLEQGKITGKTVDVMRCVLDKQALPYNIQVYPWRRALNLFSNANLEMVFGANVVTGWPSNTVSSAPLDLEKWFWYSATSSHKPALTSSIATIAGSNQDSWLQQHGYSNLFYPPNLESAVKMLRAGRVNFMLADETYVDHLLLSQNPSSRPIAKSFSRFSPQYAYFSPLLIERTDSIVENFDRHIGECNPAIQAVDLHTEAALKKSANHLNAEINQAQLRSALIQAKKNQPSLSTDRIVRQEATWQLPNSRLVSRILNSSVSTSLNALASKNRHIVQEVFLTDQLGFVVGMSRPTTDYWQGDEQNFISVAQGSDAVQSVSNIYFDESTRSFQSQVSLRISDPDTGEFLGVLVFGLALEAVMEHYFTTIEMHVPN
ncbi:substrate-binding periplasmic protein [Reinekea sp.]|uniref:substrate-binding periplasmic protein n=1 Tax=Reinekea sp. TaxID=1970455 RepID=UPI003988FE6A